MDVKYDEDAIVSRIIKLLDTDYNSWISGKFNSFSHPCGIIVCFTDESLGNLPRCALSNNNQKRLGKAIANMDALRINTFKNEECKKLTDMLDKAGV